MQQQQQQQQQQLQQQHQQQQQQPAAAQQAAAQKASAQKVGASCIQMQKLAEASVVQQGLLGDDWVQLWVGTVVGSTATGRLMAGAWVQLRAAARDRMHLVLQTLPVLP